MKFFLTIIILGIIYQTTNAQLTFKIEELSLANYDIKIDENIIDEDIENGPFVYLNCLITNKSNDSIILKPAKSKVKIVFRYKGRNYTQYVEPLPFIDKEKLVLLPKDSIDLNFGSYLLLGTDLYNNKQGSYIKEMLSVLPTLKVVYHDELIEIWTNEIEKVILK